MTQASSDNETQKTFGLNRGYSQPVSQKELNKNTENS